MLKMSENPKIRKSKKAKKGKNEKGLKSRYGEKARETPSVKKGENGDKTGTHSVSFFFESKTTFWYLLILAVDFLQSVDCIASSLWGKRGQKAGSWQSHNLIPVQNKSKQSNSDDSARWDSLGKHKSNDKGSLHRICFLKHPEAPSFLPNSGSDVSCPRLSPFSSKLKCRSDCHWVITIHMENW